MKKVYILLTATNTFFARFIRYYTKTPYSHASISLDPKCKELYSFARTYTYNPFVGSFQKENINEKVFGRFPNIPCELLEVTVSNNQYKEIQNLIKTMDGKSYNKLGLLCKLFNIPYTQNKKYFCSEFVAYTLQSCNVYKFNKPLNFIEPTEFLYLPIVKTVYKGNLHNIKQD